MKAEKTIEVRAERFDLSVDVCEQIRQCDNQTGWSICQEGFETIALAKKYAKRVLTADFLRVIESSGLPFNYAQVIVNGECHSDYFGD
jgi:hypothetical protein